MIVEPNIDIIEAGIGFYVNTFEMVEGLVVGEKREFKYYDGILN